MSVEPCQESRTHPLATQRISEVQKFSHHYEKHSNTMASLIIKTLNK